MIYSPFSRPTRFELPSGKGIYLHPTGPEAPSGWGEPRYTPEGVKIVPGTPGGPSSNVLLKDDGTIASNNYHQRSGCITWWGKLVDPVIPAKGRHVLSYNGSRNRYFRDPLFTYGANETHNEIYYKGAYATVAPAPVLGACFRDFPFVDMLGETTVVTWIVAAVYEAGEDRFYRKVFRGVTKADGMTDAIREQSMRKYDYLDAPEGWIFMGSFPRQGTAYAPDTPWFFNESGTEASCMRRVALTFNNGGTPGEVTEDKYDRYQASIGANTVTVQNLGNLQPMEYLEDYEKIRSETYISTDADGNHHEWQEDHIRIDITLDGEQNVLCDYRGDDLVVGRMVYNTAMSQLQFWSLGIDPNPYFGDVNPQEENISNEGSRAGPLPYPPDYIPEPGDHYPTQWLGYQAAVRLFIGPASAPDEVEVAMFVYRTGTSDEWAGHPRQDNNPFLYFYSLGTRYVRGGMDARDFFMVAQDRHVYALRVGATSTHNRNDKKTEAAFFSENFEGRTYRSINTPSSGVYDIGFTNAMMDEWPENFANTLSRQTYIGAWVSGNYAGEIQEPGSKTYFFNDALGDTSAGWPTIPELVDNLAISTTQGNGVRTETGRWAFSIEIPDGGSGSGTVLLSDTTDQVTLNQYVGYGAKFFPLGAA